MEPPRLPWEVIERVIGHSGDWPHTLRNLSLTCHELRPRALCLLVAHVLFETRVQIFDFCDFLEASPHLKPFVRSMTANLINFAPFPLLHILPNLSEISFTSLSRRGGEVNSPTKFPESNVPVEEDGRPIQAILNSDESVEDDDSFSLDQDHPCVSVDDAQRVCAGRNDSFAGDESVQYNGLSKPVESKFPIKNTLAMVYRPTPVILNQLTLTCCQRFGTGIQSLRLFHISFPTYLEFAQALLAFTNIIHLACKNVIINEEGNRAALDVLKPRLSERLRLVTIDFEFFDTYSWESCYDAPSVAALLLDSGLVQSTVEALTVRGMYRSNGLSQLFSWPRLRSLALKFLRDVTTRDVTDAILFLKDFSPSTPKDVVVEMYGRTISAIIKELERDAGPGLLEKLEQTLLGFPQPRIVCGVHSLHDGRDLFWTQELGKRFPVLSQRGALTMRPTEVILGAGHDDTVAVLTTSPDGRWVATGSLDSTIILWDTTDGTIARQWVAHSYSDIRSLAFSPDGRYLVSNFGHDPMLKVWDLGEGSREVATLEGHTHEVARCAWSPRGDVIASSSEDKTIRLWDGRTFHQLRVLEQAHEYTERTIEFSPDGRWLVSGCFSTGDYYIWDVVSGTLHKSVCSRLDPGYAVPIPIAADFDPGSTRLVIIPEHGAVKIVDVETGEELAVLRGVDVMTDVAFSPDGTLVLIVSDSNMVKIWNPYVDVGLRFSLEGHEDRVSQARFSPCGKYVASASLDCTVRLWRTRDGSCIAIFPEHERSVSKVAFSPDGKTLWSGDYIGTVIMRRMNDILPEDDL